WMLPAPAQGAVMVACRAGENELFAHCQKFNNIDTEICVKIERDFLTTLMGGCSTPICALAEIKEGTLTFKGNIFSIDGNEKIEIEAECTLSEVADFGIKMGQELLAKGADKIVAEIRNFGA
ncbi:MAG: hydroxymethylbilane synthase, partial [Chitinophagaceae bacterium]|nr:hydroxymethylbilane synthase [Chitinophagaceae bacterium]